MKKVDVREAGNKGKGVFAVENIKQGDHILDIDDTHVIDTEEDLPEEEREHIDYLAKGMVHMQSPEVYINHSCNPNVYVRTVDGVRKLFAMKDILPDDEIAYDYAINGDYGWGARCGCGSDNCRGILDNNFWHLSIERQKEYLPYLDGWFRDKYPEKIKSLGSLDSN